MWKFMALKDVLKSNWIGHKVFYAGSFHIGERIELLGTSTSSSTTTSSFAAGFDKRQPEIIYWFYYR